MCNLIVPNREYARKNNILQSPYGRAALPTPLITEEEFVQSEGWNASSFEDVFNFQYGFNPVRFMADYIKWAHPNSANERYLLKQQAFESLKAIGKHALHRDVIQNELSLLSVQLQSGILWGPFNSPISCSSVLFICQPMFPGLVHLELSLDTKFSDIYTSVQVQHDPFQTNNTDNSSSSDTPPYPSSLFPAKIAISGLQGGKRYYVRCHLIRSVDTSGDVDDNLSNVSDNFVIYRYANFWTLPSDEAVDEAISQTTEQFSPVTLVTYGIHTNLSLGFSSSSENLPLFSPNPIKSSQFADSSCVVTCLLGDPFASDLPNGHGSRVDYPKSLYYNFYHDLSFIASKESLSYYSSMLFSWNDNRMASDINLRHEEHLYSQYLHELKKLDKKSKKKPKSFGKRKDSDILPVVSLQRPPISKSLKAMVEGFPIICSEESTYNLYHSMMIGSELQVFILDLRYNYLGELSACL